MAQTTRQQIEKLNTKIDTKFKEVNLHVNQVESKLLKKIDPLHDFVVGQIAIQKANRYKPSNKNDNETISISREIVNIIKWLVLIIAAIIGVKL